MPNATGQLLRDLEPLTHDDRVRRLIAIGRSAAGGDARSAAILAELAAGGVYERLLALHACQGRGDGDLPARLAGADPSRLIRRMALPLVARLADDDAALAALLASSPADRLALLRQLRRRGRTAPADALLEALAASGDTDSIELLVGFGSPEGVARHLATALGRGGLVVWSRLARSHPTIAARAMIERVERTGDDDPGLLVEANATLPLIAQAQPDAAAGLAEVLARRYPLGRLVLGPLVNLRPRAVADLVLASADQVTMDFGRAATRLDDGRLLTLLDQRPATLSNGRERWFRRLRLERRRRVFAAVGSRWRNLDGALPADLVALLPRDLREPEARRNLALPDLATRPDRLAPYASSLPWDEARAALAPGIGHPEGDRRAVAIAALIGVARHDRSPERRAEVLRLVMARKNEQDPVRLAMISALRVLPPSTWTAADLDGLGRVLRDALDAADLSYTTAYNAEGLVVRLVPFHPDWAGTWLATLARERGSLEVSGLDGALSDADVRRLAPALAPVLVAWRGRESEGQLYKLAARLGRRLPVFAGLSDLMESLVRKSKTPWISTSALGLLASHDRPRFARLVPDLLRSDPSWATQTLVADHLHRRRQDLIGRFLGRSAYKGRFGTGKVRHVLPFTSGFFRWTPNQQSEFSETLDELTRGTDPNRDTPTILGALAQFAALPMVPHDRLIALASDTRPAVRDAAIRALGDLDTDEGIPTLLEAMGDDRARIAIYALRPALLAMPSGRAAEILRSAPTAKVTVAKEVARLLGELRDDAGLGPLRELEAAGPHRDVKIAILRALWSHLERAESWDSLDRAADDADPAVVSGVIRTPDDRLSPTARARLASLMGRLLGHPDPSVRVAVLHRLVNDPASDPDRLLLARSIELLSSPVPIERSAAATAVTYTARPADAATFAAAIPALLPNRRALDDLVTSIALRLNADRARLTPVALAIAGALDVDPLTTRLRLDLTLAALSGDDLADSLVELAESGRLHADALAHAIRVFPSAANRPDRAGLERVEALLTPLPDPTLRRLALAALVAVAGTETGWTPERIERLGGFRRDPSPLVAEAAQFTFRAGE